MGIRVDGVRQMIGYGYDYNKLWYRLTLNGDDVTSPDAAPSCQYYDNYGKTIGSAVTLTQDSTTGWYYYALDASSTTGWYIGSFFRALVSFDVSSATYYRNFLHDVCRDPINEPLLGDNEFDEIHPNWASERHTSLTDWTSVLYQSHRELLKNLGDCKDSDGKFLLPWRILNREALKEAAISYAEFYATHNAMMSSDDEREYYRNKKAYAVQNIQQIFLDADDDLIVEPTERRALGMVTLEH